MKPLRLSPLAILLVAAVAAIGTSLADDSAGTNEASNSRTGAEIYHHICQGCHLEQGEGAVGAGAYPRLAGNTNLASWQFIGLTVLNGRTAMPAFGSPVGHPAAPGSAQLSDAEVAQIVNFVRTHFRNNYAETVNAAQISELPHPEASGH